MSWSATCSRTASTSPSRSTGSTPSHAPAPRPPMSSSWNAGAWRSSSSRARYIHRARRWTRRSDMPGTCAHTTRPARVGKLSLSSSPTAAMHARPSNTAFTSSDQKDSMPCSRSSQTPANPLIPVREFLAEDAYAPLPSIIQTAYCPMHQKRSVLTGLLRWCSAWMNGYAGIRRSRSTCSRPVGHLRSRDHRTRPPSAARSLIYAALFTAGVQVLFFTALQIEPYYGLLAPLMAHVR